MLSLLAIEAQSVDENAHFARDAAGANLTMGSHNIDIGNAGVAGESNTVRIGTVGTQTAVFIAGIRGTAVAETAVGNHQRWSTWDKRLFKAIQGQYQANEQGRRSNLVSEACYLLLQSMK